MTLRKPDGTLVNIELDQNEDIILTAVGFNVEQRQYPRIGQYIQLKKSIAEVKSEPQYNFEGHPEIPEGSWVKVTGWKMDKSYLNIEYKADDGKVYNTTPRLYPEDYHVLPATDDTEVARILYDNKNDSGT